MNIILRAITGVCLLLFGLVLLEQSAWATFTLNYGSTNDVYFLSRGGGYITTGSSPTTTTAYPITHTVVSDVSVSGTTVYLTISYGQNSTGGTNRRMRYTDSFGTTKYLSYILYTSSSTFASPVIIADNTTDITKMVSAGTSWTANNAKNLVYNFSISPTGQNFDSNVVYSDLLTVTGYSRVGTGAFNQIGTFVLGINCTPVSIMSVTVGSNQSNGTLD